MVPPIDSPSRRAGPTPAASITTNRSSARRSRSSGQCSAGVKAPWPACRSAGCGSWRPGSPVSSRICGSNGAHPRRLDPVGRRVATHRPQRRHARMVPARDAGQVPRGCDHAGAARLVPRIAGNCVPRRRAAPTRGIGRRRPISTAAATSPTTRPSSLFRRWPRCAIWLRTPAVRHRQSPSRPAIFACKGPHGDFFRIFPGRLTQIRALKQADTPRRVQQTSLSPCRNERYRYQRVRLDALPSTGRNKCP